MDDLLQQVLAESKRLSGLGKEAGYEAFVRLVEMRGQLIEAISDRELTEEQRQRLQELKIYEPILLRHMDELKSEAEAGLRSIRNSKIQRQGYLDHAPAGSWLFDRRS